MYTAAQLQAKLETLKSNAEQLQARLDELQNKVENWCASDYFDENDRDWTDQYDDALDDCNEAYMGFCASTILKECDPIAYRIGFQEWIDALDKSDFEEIQDLESEIESLDDQILVCEEEIEEIEQQIEDLTE